MIDFSKILVPVDFSEHSANAIETALTLAHTFSGEVILLHVIDSYYIGEGFYLSSGIDVTEVMSEITEKKKTRLKELSAELVKSGIKTSARVVSGVPHRKIVDFAEKTDCSLIIMGRAGRRQVSEVIMGSVTSKVASRSPCSVLVIKKSQSKDESFVDRVIGELKGSGLLEDVKGLLTKAGFYPEKDEDK
jgi:nucleotide-binding universal stress UspA family protein